MVITTQPAVSAIRAPSAIVGRFDFLEVEERRPAQISYEFFSDLIASSRVMPLRIWFDLDDTLIRPREEYDPIVFQGAIVGAMRAFHEGRVPVGIFSFWSALTIWDLIDDCPFLTEMVSLDKNGTPLIRGVEHINGVAMALADPERGVHAMMNDENNVIYYDSEPVLTENKCRAMKIIRRNEMLIDNDDISVYWRLALHFGPTLQLWKELSFVQALDHSTKGYLHLDNPEKTPVPKYLSSSEMARAVEIFKRLEWEEGFGEMPPTI